MAKIKTGAILTADVVNSTNLDESLKKKLFSSISKLLTPNRYEFYRGDSLQVSMNDATGALTLALLIRTLARQASPLSDVRISIGIGDINPLTRKLSTADGPAFILSGHAFDELTRNGQRLAIQSDQNIANPGFNVMAYFVDYLLMNFTMKQAAVVHELLIQKTQAKAAKKLGKSASTINQHATAAGYGTLLQLIEEYKTLVKLIA